MATYEQLGISKAIADKLIAASRTEGLEQLATPEGAKAFVDAGGDLSDAVKGIGNVTELQVLSALASLSEGPDLEDTELEDTESEDPPVVEKPAGRMITVTMEVPVAPIADGYEAKQASGGRLQMGRPTQKTQVQLTPDEAVAFLQIREGLLRNDRRLPNGEPVKSNADVVRWFLGQVMEAASPVAG